MTNALNRRVKTWPGWALLCAAVVVVFAVAASADRGPLDDGDRVDAITRRIACPICDGESVFESRNPASEGIRSSVIDSVDDGVLSDDEIIAAVADAYGAQVLLVPRTDGLDALAWALPVGAGVIGVFGLAVAFRRWRDEARATAPVSAADRDIVERYRRGGVHSDDASGHDD